MNLADPITAPRFALGEQVRFVAWSCGTFDYVPGRITNIWIDDTKQNRYDIQRKPGWAYTGIYESHIKGME